MANVIVKGMNCDHCKSAVTKAIAALPGITGVTVDLATGKAEWRGDESREAARAVKEAVEEAGFEVLFGARAGLEPAHPIKGQGF